MTRRLRTHQCIDFARSAHRKMVARHGKLWAIAALVLLASLSFSTSVKLRKPRKRLTTKTPYQQSRIGPVIIRVMHKYPDNGLARDASAGCANGNCKNPHDKFNLDVNEALSDKDNFLSDEVSWRYVVHPKEYEHFVLKKNTGHASRYKRDSAFPELHPTSASDRTMVGASDASRNENKRNLTRVPLYRVGNYRGVKDLSRSLSEAGRTRRSVGADYSSRKNDSDYYAQRRAVMERYYARQREINARYANRTGVIAPRLEYNDVPQHRPVTSNATLFKLGRAYPSKDSTARDNAIFHYPPTKIDPIYSNESRYNRIPTELDTRRNVLPSIDPGFKSDANLPQTRGSDNVERNALDYFVTPTPCTNISLSGTHAPKARAKHDENCTRETEQSNEDSTDDDNAEGNQKWGRCKGKIVYQHNLLLGLTGPSNLDALFEVIIQGPVCITCVQALRYNETRATVTLDSGGPNHEYAKLRLQGYENEGFSYIIKVWGVKKIDEVCDNVD